MIGHTFAVQTTENLSPFVSTTQRTLTLSTSYNLSRVQMARSTLSSVDWIDGFGGMYPYWKHALTLKKLSETTICTSLKRIFCKMKKYKSINKTSRLGDIWSVFTAVLIGILLYLQFGLNEVMLGYGIILFVIFSTKMLLF